MKNNKGINVGTLLLVLWLIVGLVWLIATNRIAVRGQEEIEELQAAVYDVREELGGLRTEQEVFRDQYLEDQAANAAKVEQLEEEQTELRGNVSNALYTLRKMTRQKAQEEAEKEEGEQQAAEVPRAATSSADEVTEPFTEAADEAPEPSAEGMTYLGNYVLTAYAWSGNLCSSGVYPTLGRTVASTSIPEGTWIYIEGVGTRVVEDTGPLAGNVIDVYMGDAETCRQFGTWSTDVYILE